MDNKFLDEVLDIARREWRGTVERKGRMFLFKAEQLDGASFEILQSYNNSARHRIFETPAHTWLGIEMQLERQVSEYARNLVFTKTVEEKNREAGW